MSKQETKTETAIALLEQAQLNYQKETTEGFARLEKKVEENHADIIKRMEKFAFVSQKDHNRDLADVYKAIEDAKEELRKEYSPTTKVYNMFNNNFTRGVVVIVVTAVFGAIIVFGSRIFPAAGGGF